MQLYDTEPLRTVPTLHMQANRRAEEHVQALILLRGLLDLPILLLPPMTTNVANAPPKPILESDCVAQE
jgi:hypothetical protein